MIAMVLWGSCGAPAGDLWELEPMKDAPPPEAAEPPEDDLPNGLTNVSLHDDESGVTVAIPSGWRAWPGAPNSPIRFHLEHALSGATFRLQHSDEMPAWPQDSSCKWSFEETGLYSGLKHGGAVESATCWPEIPGDSRRIAWRLEDSRQFWLVEVEVPGGAAGIVDEALELLMPGIDFE